MNWGACVCVCVSSCGGAAPARCAHLGLAHVEVRLREHRLAQLRVREPAGHAHLLALLLIVVNRAQLAVARALQPRRLRRRVLEDGALGLRQDVDRVRRQRAQEHSAHQGADEAAVQEGEREREAARAHRALDQVDAGLQPGHQLEAGGHVVDLALLLQPSALPGQQPQIRAERARRRVAPHIRSRAIPDHERARVRVLHAVAAPLGHREQNT